jgi:hypothetical protein
MAAAAFLPPSAWYAYQQGLSVILRHNCGAAGLPMGPLLGVAALIACAVAFVLANRGRASVPNPGRRFAVGLMRGSAVIFALAIGFQTLATALIPPCVA